MLHFIPLSLIYSISEASLKRHPHALCMVVLQPKEDMVSGIESPSDPKMHLHHHQRKVKSLRV